MNFPLRLWLTAAAAAFLASSTFARIDRVVEKTFSVSPTGTLFVECSGGGIRVDPVEGTTATITARQRIQASSDAEADELLKKLELVIEQDGDNLRVSSKYAARPFGFRFGSWPPVQVEFEIRVPAGFATNLRTSGGSIRIGDLTGKTMARTSGGSIKLGRLGSGVEAHTSGGSITLAEAAGAVDLHTSGGSVTVGKIAGPADVSTSGGGIRIDSASGKVRAHTSGGSVRAGLVGAVDESSFSTSGGSVHVSVDRALAFRLDASSSGGGVHADGLTIRLEKSGSSRTRLAGDVNGGGPLVKLRSSGGSVHVESR